MNHPNASTFEVIDSIGIISLNNPPANELSIPGFIPLDQFHKWMDNPTIKGMIIRGDGKNFSAGGNLGTIFKATKDPASLQSLMQEGLQLLKAIENLDIPVIAAINRVCFGGGLEIALACHLRVASENALLAFPEANHNMMPGMGGTARLTALTGFSQSAAMILGGDMIDAETARKLGIVDHIAPKDQAFEHAWTLMQKMTHDRPVKVIRSIMTALKNAVVLSQEEAMKEEIRLFCSLAEDEAERRKKEEA